MNIIKTTTDIKGYGFDNKNVMKFHTRVPFEAGTYWSGFRFGFLSKYQPDKFILAITQVPGVTYLSCFEHDCIYDLTVKKATAFDWDEIVPAIIQILEQREIENSK